MPKKPKTDVPSRARIDLRADPALRARIARQAERFGMNLSVYIRAAVIRQVEEHEKSERESTRPGDSP